MKVVHINNFDVKGGAARAAFRIFNSLRLAGHDVNYLVQKKATDFDFIDTISDSNFSNYKSDFRMNLEAVNNKRFNEAVMGKFSDGKIGIDISKHELLKNADIINLHWINGGFLSLSSLEKIFNLNKPIVWTLHDMWAFTGGCHYSKECENYLRECGNCPCLKNSSQNDLSNKIVQKKKEIFSDKNLTIVTSSKWLGSLAQKSNLFADKNVIASPTPVETEIYKDYNKDELRKEFGLPKDKVILLFGTMTTKDKRKGFHYLQDALHILNRKYPELKNKVELLVFGRHDENAPELPFKVNYLGRLDKDLDLAKAYAAADFSVLPSLEDNLPNTVLESLSCARPVVAFNIGGMPDMIDHLENGFLVENIDAGELADGIHWVINQETNLDRINNNSRNKIIQNFSYEKIAENYSEIYRSLI